MQTTLKQKVFLVLFSIFLTIVFLEVGLRIGGVTFLYFQQRNNAIQWRDDQLHILCIGESTTALGGENGYPFQLEEILNKKMPDIRFKVINAGLVAKKSAHILMHLEENLDKYNPEIVVAMIGINDKKRIPDPILHKELFYENFRIYKLWTLLNAHIRHKIMEMRQKESETEDKLTKEDPEHISTIRGLMGQLAARRIQNNRLEHYYQRSKSPEIKQELERGKQAEGWVLVAIGQYYRERKDYALAKKYLNTALYQIPDEIGAYFELGRCYKEQKEYEKAVFLFKRAIELYPDTVLGFMELAEAYDYLGEKEEVRKIYEWVLQKNPDNIWIYTEMGKWFKEEGHYEQSVKAYLSAYDKNPTDYAVCEQLADIYAIQGNLDEARKFQEKAQEGQAQREYSSYTIENYNKIADIIQQRGIKLICMQYPLRSIAPLKEILSSKEGIVFVENKENFEKILRDSKYSKVFSDNFAGDFGHCTRTGNRLIAENLANTILDLLNNP